MSILADILARKEAEIAALPDTRAETAEKRSLVDAVRSSHPSLIAEVKPMSPTKGRLIDDTRIPALIDVYERHADAMSVLCDSATFGGSFALISSIRSLTDLPLLAKDFIVERKQIDAAASAGADAVLLIATLLRVDQLAEYARYAMSLGLDVLLEVHEEAEVDTADILVQSLTTEEHAKLLIGINNRNLDTQSIDLTTTQRVSVLLRQCFAERFPLVSESGVSSPTDIGQLTPHVQGFLIGSAILTSDDPDLFLSTLFPQP